MEILLNSIKSCAETIVDQNCGALLLKFILEVYMFKEELSVSIGKILMENGHKMIVTKKDCVYFI